MKSTGIFLAALFGFSTLVSIAMLVTATMKPELFMSGGKKPHADSLQTHIKKDSTALLRASAAEPSVHGDTAAVSAAGVVAAEPAASTDSAPVKKESIPAVPSAQSAQASAAKEDDLQNLVKLYEAMKPEDAAKILGKMQDKEIRTIVLHLKKKQAAKVISFFDANRAAQILTQ